MEQEQITTALTPEQEKFTKRWSWGAFANPTVYFFGSGLIREGIYTLIPFLNIYIWIKGIFRGRKIAWEKGDWRNWEAYEKRQRILDKIGIVILIIAAVVIIVPSSAIYLLTQQPAKSARLFFEDIAAGRIEKAYNDATPGFRELGSLEDFELFVEDNAYMRRYKKASFPNRSISGSTATLTGKIITENGEKYPIEMDLQKIDGAWRVHGLEFQ